MERDKECNWQMSCFQNLILFSWTNQHQKLDKRNKHQIIESINSNFRDKTLIIVSHEYEERYDNMIKLKLKGGQLFYEA